MLIGFTTFWSIIAFEGKLALSDAGISTALSHEPTLCLEWRAIRNRLQKKSKNRNKLAHGQVVPVSPFMPDGQPAEDVFFIPYFAGGLLTSTPFSDQERLSVKHINDIANGFSASYVRLLRLIRKVGTMQGAAQAVAQNPPEIPSAT